MLKQTMANTRLHQLSANAASASANAMRSTGSVRSITTIEEPLPTDDAAFMSCGELRIGI